MPTHIHKSIHFFKPENLLGTELKSTARSARLKLISSPEAAKIVPLLPEVVQTGGLSRLRPLPYCRRREGVAAVLLALALHLAWLATAPYSEVKEPTRSPSPIQVDLITSIRPAAAKTIAEAGPQSLKKTPTNTKTKPAVSPEKIRQKKPRVAPASSAKTLSIQQSPETSSKASQTPASRAETAAETAVSKPDASVAEQTNSTPSSKPASSNQPLIMPNLNADYLDNPAPAYPEEARARGEQGRVMVRAMIDANGKVIQLAVQRSSGHSSLDQAALATVKGWRFVPARRGEHTVAAWVVVPISFSLEG